MNKSNVTKENYVEPVLDVVNLSNTPILADSTRSCGEYGTVCYRYDD